MSPPHQNGIGRDVADWVAIDQSGIFVCSSSSVSDVAMLPIPAELTPNRLVARQPSDIVRTELVDRVDCAATTHNFQDNGSSGVIELGGTTYRTTTAPQGFAVNWFAYEVQCQTTPGVPCLLVAQIPNDRERYTVFTVDVPQGAGWAPPFAGEERYPHDPLEISQEPDWYHPDVGLCVYTGRRWRVDGKPRLVSFLFYPKSPTVLITIATSGWDLDPPSDHHGGAAVSRMWVFKALDPLPPAISLPPALLDSQRKFGMYVTHPWYFLSRYGYPPRTRQQRRSSLEAMLDHLCFCGMNWLEFNILNGSDRTARAWYDSEYFQPFPCNLIEELLPLARERDIKVLPVVTSLAIDMTNQALVEKYGFSRASFQHPAQSTDPVRSFDSQAPDPLRPEVQQFAEDLISEVAVRVAPYTHVPGVGLRVNGKIGLCYNSWEDKSGTESVVRPAHEAGYSLDNLKSFEHTTGVRFPTDVPNEAFAWLRADPQRWEAWLAYRCQQTQLFWLRLRDRLRAYRQNWLFYLLTDLPAELPATNVQWPGPDHPQRQSMALELLREHGYDPRLYTDAQGIVVQQVMMADADVFWLKWMEPWRSNPERYRTFYTQPYLHDWYRTPAGYAVEVYHNYWEVPFHPRGEFGIEPNGYGMRTPTATPIDRGFYEQMTYALRHGNVDTLAILGWERPTLGHESGLRRFARAFLALPKVDPLPFPGRVLPERDTLWVRVFDNRIAVLNDSPETVETTLVFDTPVQTVTDLVSGNLVSHDRGTCTLVMEPYDLRVLQACSPTSA